MQIEILDMLTGRVRRVFHVPEDIKAEIREKEKLEEAHRLLSCEHAAGLSQLCTCGDMDACTGVGPCGCKSGGKSGS